MMEDRRLDGKENNAAKTTSLNNIDAKRINMKNRLTQKQRFQSFSKGQCPYCGNSGAALTEIQTTGARGVKGKDKHLVSHTKGYHGACTNPDCKAENYFTNKAAQEWV